MVRHHALHGEIYADPASGFSFCSATWRISTMILRVDFIILNGKRKCKFLKSFDSVNLKLVKCLTNPNNITFFESNCAEKSLGSGISIKNGRLMLKD